MLTAGTMLYIARRMQAQPEPRPDRRRDALPAHARQHHARQHGRRDGAEVVPVHRDALPLHLVLEPHRLHPAADEHRAQVRPLRRSRSRRFALYAATANISMPLVLDAHRLVSLPRRGHPRQGLRRLPQGLVPAGVDGRGRVPIFVIEFISHFIRLISLSVRLFANILAGHLMILFMAGGLASCSASRRSAVFTLPIGVALLPLRGRPGRHAAGLHLRHPHCDLPRRRRRRAPLKEQAVSPSCSPPSLTRPRRRQDDGSRRRQGHRARRRRRPRRHRPRRRRRLHLRQGHRVGDPPARDARRDHRRSSGSASR